jgi:hypothetical protein
MTAPIDPSRHEATLPTVEERPPGRSFTDPRRPLGEDLIERSDPSGGDRDESFYGRAADHYPVGHGVAERARCVAVLRKAEELMASGNPAGDTDEGRRRALELAAGRCGVRIIEEYDRVVDDDEELQALEATVMNAAAQRVLKMP